MSDTSRLIQDGYHAKRISKDQRGYQPKGRSTPLDPLKLKPPKGGTAIEPPTRPANK
jgi:hypothetical protein